MSNECKYKLSQNAPIIKLVTPPELLELNVIIGGCKPTAGEPLSVDDLKTIMSDVIIITLSAAIAHHDNIYPGADVETYIGVDIMDALDSYVVVDYNDIMPRLILLAGYLFKNVSQYFDVKYINDNDMVYFIDVLEYNNVYLTLHIHIEDPH